MAEKIATRHAYGEALAEIGSDPKIVALDADVSSCTMSCMFAQKYPERFFNMGIAEANMIGAAAGLSTYGFTPFVHAFAMFMAGRGYDQIRNSICYPNLNVKCVGTHGGLSVGEDGATHQCVEDIALMRAVPNMTVICPADANETRAAVHAIAAHEGPVYLRLGRVPVETVTDFPGYQFTIGKSVTLREGTEHAGGGAGKGRYPRACDRYAYDQADRPRSDPEGGEGDRRNRHGRGTQHPRRSWRRSR